ncbi:hypothetical protein GZH47_31845 (plasmid) [Paenibacillus rhizovicinus]|uniref:Uncharacterized protein n=1 Tax=Paenibacillus rhizovicinus TaxID=2704463 RepID=A0A6C0PAG6_9BACL|nr:DNA cytosine methyltransferase [Paenibacillus rhizovicinus]QHW35489.1 hypothetical protein GZH47_31845 [Paenibacillus rhizovicinus]
MQCIPRRYRSHSASNSYVLNEDRTQWRFFTVSELRRIFSIPEWFKWPAHIPITRIYEQIGQSVCGRVIRAFANEIASLFFRRYAMENKKQLVGPSSCGRVEQTSTLSFSLDQSGQMGFLV